MDGTLVIVLIVVVWIFVLAPLVLGGNNKPIRKSGEAYEETRVLHEGGTEPLQPRRRPKLTREDIHRYDNDEADDLEVVDAVEEPEEKTVLIDDTNPHHFRPFFAKKSEEEAEASEEVLDNDEDHVEDHDVDPEAAQGEADLIDGEVVAEDAEPAEESAEAETADSENAPKMEVADTQIDNDDIVTAIAPQPLWAEDEPVEDTYALDDSYLNVDDIAYSQNGNTVVSLVDDVPEQEDTTEKASEPVSTELQEEESTEAASAEELTEEEIAFAKSRRGRGAWDPESDATYKVDRYQRRQRTFLGLVALFVVTLIVAIFVGSWAWIAPVIGAGLIAWYLIALRKLVRQERALRARRIRQLRRARLGVKSSDASAPVPRELRRPGAVIVEADDESPDFDHLPLTYAHFESEEEDQQPPVRPRRVS